jgi:hypothetical protein
MSEGSEIRGMGKSEWVKQAAIINQGLVFQWISA